MCSSDQAAVFASVNVPSSHKRSISLCSLVFRNCTITLFNSAMSSSLFTQDKTFSSSYCAGFILICCCIIYFVKRAKSSNPKKSVERDAGWHRACPYTTHNPYSLVKHCLTFLATRPNVQARWHSLLEKLIDCILLSPLGARPVPVPPLGCSPRCVRCYVIVSMVLWDLTGSMSISNSKILLITFARMVSIYMLFTNVRYDREHSLQPFFHLFYGTA